MPHLALNMQRQIVDDVMEGSFHGHSGCTHMSAAAKIGSDFAHIYLFLRTKRNLEFHISHFIQENSNFHTLCQLQLADDSSRSVVVTPKKSISRFLMTLIMIFPSMSRMLSSSAFPIT